MVNGEFDVPDEIFEGANGCYNNLLVSISPLWSFETLKLAESVKKESFDNS